MPDKKFLDEVLELASKYPDDVVKIEKVEAPADGSQGKVCIRWGVNPDTGEMKCLEWRNL